MIHDEQEAIEQTETDSSQEIMEVEKEADTDEDVLHIEWAGFI